MNLVARAAALAAGIRNASPIARRGASYTVAEELRVNRGVDGPAMLTLDQLDRATGIRAVHIPASAGDTAVPLPSMRFESLDGTPVPYWMVTRQMDQVLGVANAAAPILGRVVRDPFSEVEAAIAAIRNARGLPQEHSLSALETDLVKLAVLGFQVGTERDRQTMSKLGRLTGRVAHGLRGNRDLREARAVFELGVRKLPEGVPYLTVAGVRDAIRYVYRELDFNEQVIRFLRDEVPTTRGWTSEQWNYLRNFKSELKKVKITGLPDGSIYTGGPLLKVEGPPILCELIETAIMARISPMTAKATALALVKEVFSGKFAELGARRPPSADSMTKDVEALNVVADVPSSYVLAQYLNCVRAVGTMEHSAILLNGTDAEAAFFVQWFLMYGEHSAALVDSRTPEEGVKAVIKAQQIIDALKPKLEKDPAYAHIKSWKIPAIRLDSGDLQQQAVKFRKMLDAAGMNDTDIFIMDGMNHEKLKKILFDKDGNEVRIDSTGAGESLRFPIALNDAGNMSQWLPQMIYKAAGLWEGGERIDLLKLSATPSKATRPARTLHRVYDADGKMIADVAGYEPARGVAKGPAAPRGGTVVNRMELLAQDGEMAPEFSLPDQSYWQGTRARFAREQAAMPLDWRQRDALREEGKPYAVPYVETQELLGKVIAAAEAAGRGEEFRDQLPTSNGDWLSDAGPSVH